MGFKNLIDNLMYGGNEKQEDYDYEENEFDPVEEFNGEEPEAKAGTGVSVHSGSAIEMIVVKPEKLETVTQIADYLVDRKTILLNLEETNKDTARRLIDFLNGVAYAINGDLRKVATNTYVVTPSNVELSGEKLSTSQEAAFTKE